MIVVSDAFPQSPAPYDSAIHSPSNTASIACCSLFRAIPGQTTCSATPKAHPKAHSNGLDISHWAVASTFFLGSRSLPLLLSPFPNFHLSFVSCALLHREIQQRSLAISPTIRLRHHLGPLPCISSSVACSLWAILSLVIPIFFSALTIPPSPGYCTRCAPRDH